MGKIDKVEVQRYRSNWAVLVNGELLVVAVYKKGAEAVRQFVEGLAVSQNETMPKKKQFQIVSGGQTGADRTALDWAIDNGIPHSGWCPKGRIAEDGMISTTYQLQETATSQYAERTERNVVDSDGTVVFTEATKPTGGSKLTVELAKKHSKPLLHIHSKTRTPGKLLAKFIREHHIARLNVAGSRQSQEPTVGELVIRALDEALKNL